MSARFSTELVHMWRIPRFETRCVRNRHRHTRPPVTATQLRPALSAGHLSAQMTVDVMTLTLSRHAGLGPQP
ncbi:hypothetical protein AAFF_G00339020 [Aldrovandia affinis]|uniref:Uncharacterized protein n=1 Tax=Aldrovandia affinis TaxID=143900 RepID=A0AAD7R6K7_9TELE|nr:hypothetical protein AAFF_G00339020 [Aldrovandia affinis]